MSQRALRGNELTVTYHIPDHAPEWFFRCAEDGDWNGMLDYIMGRSPDSMKLT